MDELNQITINALLHFAAEQLFQSIENGDFYYAKKSKRDWNVALRATELAQNLRVAINNEHRDADHWAIQKTLKSY
tara:strand:- start:34 stop:261 length:228 start_codon:yes stop_codon:yes gene_type:complete